jgi:hypothetical protein
MGFPDVLAGELRSAVTSSMGLSLTVVVHGTPVTIGLPEGEGEIATSLALALSSVGPAETGREIVFYARAPGAFADLAADLGRILGLENAALVLDRHLEPPTAPSGLAELSQINQAVGMLLGEGHTIDTARAVLHERARRTGVTVLGVAQLLISRTAPPGP